MLSKQGTKLTYSRLSIMTPPLPIVCYPVRLSV